MDRYRRSTVELVLAAVAPVLFLAAWELLARSGTIDDRFWPPPSRLWVTAMDLLQEGELLPDIGVTLVRIVVGFLFGAVPAIALGLLMGLFWPIRALLLPIAAAIYAVPKIALLPLVFLVFGTGEAGKYVIVGVSIFFLVLVNTMAGVVELDPVFRDVARNLGASRFQLFRTVAFPGALPAIFTGLRLAMGFSLVVVVGTEFVRSRDGIGRFIYDAYEVLAIPEMFVGLIVTGVMGWLLTMAIDLVERRLLPWRPADA